MALLKKETNEYSRDSLTNVHSRLGGIRDAGFGLFLLSDIRDLS